MTEVSIISMFLLMVVLSKLCPSQVTKKERNGIENEKELCNSEPSGHYQYVNNQGKLINPIAKTPLIRKFHHSEDIDYGFEKVCDLCKVRFNIFLLNIATPFSTLEGSWV